MPYRYKILIPCLVDCDCFRSAHEYNSRALKAFPEVESFLSVQELLPNQVRLHLDSLGQDTDVIDVQDYPDKGMVRRELYPWNAHEPDRYAPDVLDYLNDELSRMAPKLEVKVAELPDLR
jgi:hypothetical protein